MESSTPPVNPFTSKKLWRDADGMNEEIASFSDFWTAEQIYWTRIRANLILHRVNRGGNVPSSRDIADEFPSPPGENGSILWTFLFMIFEGMAGDTEHNPVNNTATQLARRTPTQEPLQQPAAMALRFRSPGTNHQVNLTASGSADSPFNFNAEPTPPTMVFEAASAIPREIAPALDTRPERAVKIFYRPGPGLQLRAGYTNQWVKRHRAGRKVAEAAERGNSHAYGQLQRYRQACNAGLGHEVALRLSEMRKNIDREIEFELADQRAAEATGPNLAYRTGFEHVTRAMVIDAMDEMERHHATLTPEQLRGSFQPFTDSYFTDLTFEAVFGRY